MLQCSILTLVCMTSLQCVLSQFAVAANCSNTRPTHWHLISWLLLVNRGRRIEWELRIHLPKYEVGPKNSSCEPLNSFITWTTFVILISSWNIYLKESILLYIFLSCLNLKLNISKSERDFLKDWNHNCPEWFLERTSDLAHLKTSQFKTSFEPC